MSIFDKYVNIQTRYLKICHSLELAISIRLFISQRDKES